MQKALAESEEEKFMERVTIVRWNDIRRNDKQMDGAVQ